MKTTLEQINNMIKKLQSIKTFVEQNPEYVENSSLQDDIQLAETEIQELVRQHLES